MILWTSLLAGMVFIGYVMATLSHHGEIPAMIALGFVALWYFILWGLALASMPESR